MATGIVTTARGASLNLDELIQQANRPIGTKDAASTRANKNFHNAKPNTTKLRGFTPSSGSAVPQVTKETTVEETPSSSGKVKNNKPQTLADQTRVTVKKKASSKAVIPDDAVTSKEEDEVLGDILGELDKPTPK